MQNDPKIPAQPIEEPYRTPDEFVPGQGDVIYPGAVPDNDPSPEPDDE
ncbi:MAG: hypothetical protein WBO17_01335 [Sphingorhabdus sp.]